MTDAALLALYSRLSLPKQRVVALFAEGTKLEAIAADVGVCFHTVRRWIGPGGRYLAELQEYKAYLADQQRKTVEALQQRMATDAEAAWSRLCALALSTQTPSNVALAALDSVLDRAGLARTTKSEQKVEQTTITPEQRAERLAKVKLLVRDWAPKKAEGAAS